MMCGVIYFGCVSLKFSGSSYVCMVVEYGPNDGDGEKRRGFGMTWTRLWIEWVMGIGCVSWEI